MVGEGKFVMESSLTRSAVDVRVRSGFVESMNRSSPPISYCWFCAGGVVFASAVCCWSGGSFSSAVAGKGAWCVEAAFVGRAGAVELA